MSQKKSTASKSALSQFERLLKMSSFNLKKADEAIVEKANLLKHLCEQALELEKDIKKDLRRYRLDFDIHLKVTEDYERHKKAAEAESYAESCKA